MIFSKNNLYKAFFIFWFLFSYQISYAGISSTPKNIIINTDEVKLIKIRYTFSLNSTVNTTFFSKSLILTDFNDKITEQKNAVLRVNIKQGKGYVYERLIVDEALLDKIKRLHITKLFCKRTFVSSQTSFAAMNKPVSFHSLFTIILQNKRKQKSFMISKIVLSLPENKIRYNSKNLYVDTKIYCRGSAKVNVRFDIDNKLVSDKTVKLMCHKGIMQKRFKLHIPFELPLTKHFVVMSISDAKKVLSNRCFYNIYLKPKNIEIIKPSRGEKLNIQNANFRWFCPACIKSIYKVEFFKKINAQPILLIETRSYVLHIDPNKIRDAFKKQGDYYVKVKAVDRKGVVIAKSGYVKFGILSDDYIKGEIVVLSKPEFSLPKNILSSYKITVEGMFYLRSSKARLYLLKTKGDIFKVIKKLIKNKNILYAQPNYIFKTMGNKKTFKSDLDKRLCLNKIKEIYTGKGVSVAVIDTGVDFSHKGLRNSVVYHKNFVRSETYKPEIHGTAVAGIISSSTKYRTGIARGAKVFALRACSQTDKDNPKGVCSALAIFRAIDEALADKIDLVNMSFCSKRNNELIQWLIRMGHKNGIIFVAPVGNSRKQTNACFPASDRYVVSVGGYEKPNEFYPSKQIAQKADILAPYSNLFVLIPNNRYTFLSGTSLSCAVVTGILALCKQKNGCINDEILHPKGINICKFEKIFFPKLKE